MLILSNAFSLQMLSSFPANVYVVEISQQQAYDEIAVAMADGSEFFLNAIGHADTMSVINKIFDINLRPARINVSLETGDILIVVQLIGGRLPEGATELPEGYRFKYFQVTIE